MTNNSKRHYVMRIETTIEEKETDGVVFRKIESYDLPNGTDFEKKFVRVGINHGKQKGEQDG